MDIQTNCHSLPQLFSWEFGAVRTVWVLRSAGVTAAVAENKSDLLALIRVQVWKYDFKLDFQISFGVVLKKCALHIE